MKKRKLVNFEVDPEKYQKFKIAVITKKTSVSIALNKAIDREIKQFKKTSREDG